MRLDLHTTGRRYTFIIGIFVLTWALGTALASAAGVGGGSDDAATFNGLAIAVGAALIAKALTYESDANSGRRGFEVLPAEPVNEDTADKRI